MKTSRVRDGFVMPIVLVVLATLTLAVTIFAEQMLAEYRATRSMAGQLQAACAAQSGVEFALVQVRAKSSTSPASQTFRLQALDASREAGFWIVAERERVSGNVNYGLQNESGKLNLNGLAFDLANAEASRNRLMQLPRMTPQIADAILTGSIQMIRNALRVPNAIGIALRAPSACPRSVL